jgi:hypothetical protein
VSLICIFSCTFRRQTSSFYPLDLHFDANACYRFKCKVEQHKSCKIHFRPDYGPKDAIVEGEIIALNETEKKEDGVEQQQQQHQDQQQQEEAPPQPNGKILPVSVEE